MPWTAADIPDQHGRVAVVTGANSGLGLETARELARHGARVVMATRDQERTDEACRDIRDDVPDAELDVHELDLASLESVSKCAAGILADHDRIDVLINNAGIMGIPRRTTEDGFEMQLGVNHLGHFVLTGRLLPALLRAPGARIVSITSFARFIGRSLDRDDPHREQRSYDPWFAYGDSKQANLHFAVELDRRLRAAGAAAHSLAAHPGYSHTDLQARSVRQSDGGLSQRFWHVGARHIGMTPARGALPQLRAATDPDAEGGELYGPRWLTFGPPVRRPILSRRRSATTTLWEVSERETGEPFDVHAAVH